MVMEVIVGAIAVAFVVLTIFLILALNKLRQTLKNTDRTMIDIRKKIDEIAEPSVKLIDHLNQLTKDIAKKSEVLDVFFTPFYSKKNSKHEERKESKNAMIVDSLNLLSDGVHLFNEVKNVVKSHRKKK